MTISLLHFNPGTGLAASISATGGVSVGGYVNHSWRGVGCCATQGLYTNPWYPEKVKDAFLNNRSSDDVINKLMQQDVNFAQRQCLIIDRLGIASVMNGKDNISYIGSAIYPHIAVAGNMLAGVEVLHIMVESFIRMVCLNSDAVLASEEEPIYRLDYESQLPEMLIQALSMAIQQGGDIRGTHSAALRIESMTAAPIDIRVDWSENSVISDMNNVLTQVRDDKFKSFLSQLPIE